MEYEIKKLGEGDSKYLKELRQVFAVAFEEEDRWLGNPPTDAYLTSVLEQKYYVILVAVNNEDRVVGGLVAYILPKIDQSRSEVYLYDLAVEEQYRRQGIATRLIDELKVISKKEGAYVIFVQADNIDEPAVALYKKISDSVETDISHFNIVIK